MNDIGFYLLGMHPDSLDGLHFCISAEMLIVLSGTADVSVHLLRLQQAIFSDLPPPCGQNNALPEVLLAC